MDWWKATPDQLEIGRKAYEAIEKGESYYDPYTVQTPTAPEPFSFKNLGLKSKVKPEEGDKNPFKEKVNIQQVVSDGIDKAKDAVMDPINTAGGFALRGVVILASIGIVALGLYFMFKKELASVAKMAAKVAK